MDGFKKYLTEYAVGDIVYQAGNEQPDFYIINKGKVQVLSEDNFPLVVLSKGDFFGEEALVESQTAKCTVKVLDYATLIKIPFDQLTEMMKKSPDIALKILKKLSSKSLKIVDNVLEDRNSYNEKTGDISKIDSKDKTTSPEKETKEENDDVTSNEEKLSKNINAYIVIEKSNRFVKLEKVMTYLGRKDFSTGFVPDIDLTKEDDEKYISRKHASISYFEGDFYFSEEHGAVNGTFLNGSKMNTGVKYKINNGDKLTLCHIDIVFKY